MSLAANNIRRKGRKVVIYDRDVKLINGIAKEVFSNPIKTLARVCTVKGISVFDSTNTERVATHKLIMFYDASITAEKWIAFKGKYIKILTVENCCEADEIINIMATERGEDSKVINNA